MQKIYLALLVGILILGTYFYFTNDQVVDPLKGLTKSSEKTEVEIRSATEKIQTVTPDIENGSIEVLFRGGYQTTISLVNTESEKQGWIKEDVQNTEIVDINFDGRDDIMIEALAGAYNQITLFMVFDVATKSFVPYPITTETVEEIPSIGFVRLDAQQRTLTSFFKGRGVGDIYTEETYTFEDGEWVKTKSVAQDLIDYERQGYYIRTTIAFENGTSTEQVQYFKSTTNDSYLDLVEISKTEVQKKGLLK